MVTNMTQFLVDLTTPSKIELSRNPEPQLSRNLPLGLAIKLWLNPWVLQGVFVGTIAILVVSYFAKLGELPTFVTLWLDHETAIGIIDGVERKVTSKGKNGIQTTRFIYRYHFDLPNAQVQNGKSVSTSDFVKKNAKVKVDYSSKRPQTNRVHGMEADENNLLPFLAIVLPILGLYLIIRGFERANSMSKLLHFGTIGNAIVTHCDKTVSSGFTIGVGNFKWKVKSKSKQVPLADFQSEVWAEHRKEFDAKGKYCGNAMLRTMHIILASFFGGLLFGFPAFAFFPNGRPWLALVVASIGVILFAIVESQWHPLLRNNVRKKLDDTPFAFQKCGCQLEIQEVEVMQTKWIQKEVELKGDATDFEPRSIFFTPNKSKSAMLVEELDGIVSTDSSGIKYIQSTPAVRTILFLAAMIVIAFAGVIVVANL